MFISLDLFIDEIDSADSHHVPATVPEVLADDTPAPTATEDSRTYSNHDHPPQQVQPSSSTEEPLPTAIDPEHTEPQNDNTLSTPDPAPGPTTALPEIEEPTDPPTVQRPRRFERVRRFPKHLHDFAAHLELHYQDPTSEDSAENLTFNQARLHPQWRTAMQE